MPSAVIDEQANIAHDNLESKAVTREYESESDYIPSHPLGVKPLGNQYLSGGVNARRSIGTWAILPDEMLSVVLEHLDKESLLTIGHTCKFFYAFSHLEELWKAIYLQ